MEKTAQQKRFESVWNAGGGSDGFPRFADGSYSFGPQRIGFELFAKGEASALERAAKACDLFALHHADNYKEEGGKFIEGQSVGADECAAAIRALAQEVTK
jgi:hypothetical protein